LAGDEHDKAAGKFARRFCLLVIGIRLQCQQFAGKAEDFFKGGMSL
jgi:hypothetical protein